jgi:sec-independent protein translocase protein TatA
MNLHDAPILSALSMPGGSEWLLIFLIVIVVFGHNRIPQLGDALGKGIKNFKKAFAKDEVEAQPTHREVREVTDQRHDALDAKLAQQQRQASETKQV